MFWRNLHFCGCYLPSDRKRPVLMLLLHPHPGTRVSLFPQQSPWKPEPREAVLTLSWCVRHGFCKAPGRMSWAACPEGRSGLPDWKIHKRRVWRGKNSHEIAHKRQHRGISFSLWILLKKNKLSNKGTTPCFPPLKSFGISPWNL